MAPTSDERLGLEGVAPNDFCGDPSAQPVDPVYSVFDRRQKALIISTVSIAATLSGFSSNIYFPSIKPIAADLQVSVELINLTVTSYLVFQGLAPSFWGPVSDVKGRRVAYTGTLAVLLGANVGLALTPNYAGLMVLRCLQSLGSASTIAIGSGVVGDTTTRDERGGYMGVFQAGLLAPVAIGPIIGGALSGTFGWRAVFWFLTVYVALILLMIVMVLPETLRLKVSNGGRCPRDFFSRHPLLLYQRSTAVRWTRESCQVDATTAKKMDLLGPLRIVFHRSAVLPIAFVSIYYAIWQMSITSMSTLFDTRYGLSETQIGLTFLANGCGSIVGTLATGRVLDRVYRQKKASHEEKQRSEDSASKPPPFNLEEARIGLVPWLGAVQCLAILLFGWALQYSDQVHIAVPIVSTFFTGLAAVSIQSAIMTYLVDVFHSRSAAASAGLNLGRCLLAAGGTSFITPLIDRLGAGLAFTICFAAQALAVIALLFQMKRRNGKGLEASR